MINETECMSMVGCGYPEDEKGQLWINDNDTIPAIPKGRDVNLTILSSEKMSTWHNDEYNITMLLNGPDYIKIVLSPSPNTRILYSGPFDIANSLQVSLLRASSSPAPQTFWIVVSGWQEDERLMEAVAIGYFRHGDGVIKPGDNEFVDKHPKWVDPFAYVVDYKYYYF